jgi:hypothetical protein
VTKCRLEVISFDISIVQILKKYVNNTYLVNCITGDFENMYKIYETFFKDNIEDLDFNNVKCNNFDEFYLNYKFIQFICDNLKLDTDIICINNYLNNIKIYKGKIDINIPCYNFNTYKIYDEYKIFKERCTLRDIINI